MKKNNIIINFIEICKIIMMIDILIKTKNNNRNIMITYTHNHHIYYYINNFRSLNINSSITKNYK